MTEQLKRRLVYYAEIVTAATIITSAASVVLSALVALVFNLWGAQLLTAAGVATSDEMAAVKGKVDDLLRRVVVLARPEQVVHYRDLPMTLTETCHPGEECTIVIFAERDIRALECRVVPGRTQLLITQDSRTFAIPAIQRGTSVNLGTSPRALEPTFRLPLSLEPGEAEAHIESHYEGCLWQTDGQPPVVQESPRFRIAVEGSVQ